MYGLERHKHMRHQLDYDYFLKAAKLESLQNLENCASPAASRPDSMLVSSKSYKVRHALLIGCSKILSNM